jgi:hypothetical protein
MLRYNTAQLFAVQFHLFELEVVLDQCASEEKPTKQLEIQAIESRKGMVLSGYGNSEFSCVSRLTTTPEPRAQGTVHDC